jgi:predicted MPP superfamily phosphohydrolase
VRLFSGGTEHADVQLPGPLSGVRASMTLVLTVVALAAGAAGAVVATRSTGSSGWRTIGLGLATAAAVGAVAVIPLVVGQMRFFGIVHLAYLGATIAVPLVGLAVAARVATGPLPAPWALAGLVLLLPAPVGWYATHVEPYRLTVDRRTVPVDPARAGDDPVTIGVLADLQTNHVGDHERAAVDRLLAEEPDLILVAGDLFQGTRGMFAEQEDELRTLLARLHAPHGVYFVRGDVDHYDFADRAFAGTDVVILDDEAVDVAVGDRLLRIGGNRLWYGTPEAVALRRHLAEVADGADDGTLRILLAHRPDAVLDLDRDSRIDLTVAGHTHGGQVVLPGIGPLITMSDVPRAVSRGGLHQIDGNTIYVSNGVGLERAQAPQVRLFSRPSIGILELVDAPR